MVFSVKCLFLSTCVFFPTSKLRVSETLLRINTGSRDYLYTKERQCNSDLTFLAALVSKRLVLFSVR